MAKNKIFEQEYKAEGLRRSKERKAARKLKAESKPRKGCCIYCGNPNASYQANPFYKDMNNQIIMQYLCRDCYASACGDI